MTVVMDWLNQAAAPILLAAAILGAIYGVISHMGTFKAWIKRRGERKRMLDSLITNGHHLMCSRDLQERHSARFDDLDHKFDALTDTVKATQSTCEVTKQHNKRQDDEIGQIARVVSTTSFGVYALIEDAVVNQKKNGNLKAAYTRFNNEMRNEAIDLGRTKTDVERKLDRVSKIVKD